MLSMISTPNQNAGIVSKQKNLGKFIYIQEQIVTAIMKRRSPKTDPCGTPCLTLSQDENLS
jgi:hypothetical protein